MSITRHRQWFTGTARSMIELQRISGTGMLNHVRATCGDAVVICYVVSGRCEAYATTPEGMIDLLDVLHRGDDRAAKMGGGIVDR